MLSLAIAVIFNLSWICRLAKFCELFHIVKEKIERYNVTERQQLRIFLFFFNLDLELEYLVNLTWAGYCFDALNIKLSLKSGFKEIKLTIMEDRFPSSILFAAYWINTHSKNLHELSRVFSTDWKSSSKLLLNSFIPCAFGFHIIYLFILQLEGDGTNTELLSVPVRELTHILGLYIPCWK